MNVKETNMTNSKRSVRGLTGMFLPVLAVMIGSFVDQSAHATSGCKKVGGELMTNIGAVAGVTNLGPAFGDLAGSVAATILGQNANGTYNVQHYWVMSSGETLKLKVAILTPTFPTSDLAIVAVPWGNYRSDIAGGTGKFEGATGFLDYFGIADFNQSTLVLRYRGVVCNAQ